MEEIPLTQGQVALVDDEDYGRLSSHKWYAKREKGVFYAIRKQCGRTIRMHRVILSASTGQQVDHRDRNGLNNRRANLRFTDNYGNARNHSKQKNGLTSRYRGVCKTESGKFSARISVAGIRHGLGIFTAEEDAAAAYDKAAESFFGEFANLNLSYV